jgi:hypothetical protein
MNILAVSDIELGFIYNLHFAQRFKDIDLMISCGDLPYYYLEFMISMIDKPLYYVRGNHASVVETTSAGERTDPWGAINLHRNVMRTSGGLLLAGVEGCLFYNEGRYQYTQSEMWSIVLSMTPALFINKIRYGRYLDIFVSHAPPWKIHDKDDLPHQGIKAFRWLLKVFTPKYHLHGHIHVYRSDAVTTTIFNETTVMNCFGYRELTFNLPVQPQKPIHTDEHVIVEEKTNVG